MAIITPEFRVSYPNVFKARYNDLSNKEEFSVVAVFPKGADLSKLKAAVEKAIVDKWGEDPKKHPKNLRLPFKNHEDRMKENAKGEEYLPAPFEEGGLYLNLKSNEKPQVVDKDVEPILDSSEFYAGCWAKASVGVYAYDHKVNKGVAIGLNHLQKVRDDEPLGGKTTAEMDFVPIKNKSVSNSAKDIFS